MVEETRMSLQSWALIEIYLFQIAALAVQPPEHPQHFEAAFMSLADSLLSLIARRFGPTRQLVLRISPARCGPADIFKLRKPEHCSHTGFGGSDKRRRSHSYLTHVPVEPIRFGDVNGRGPLQFCGLTAEVFQALQHTSPGDNRGIRR